MGAFHEGHLELMRVAKGLAEEVAVSLFVNPTQFRAGEDFEKYPRDEAADFAMAEKVGVDIMFAPGVEEMYPEGERVEGRGEKRRTARGVRRPSTLGRIAVTPYPLPFTPG